MIEGLKFKARALHHMASEPASSSSGQRQRRPQAWLVWCFEHCRKVENQTLGLHALRHSIFAGRVPKPITMPEKPKSLSR